MESRPAGLPHKLQTSPTVSALSSPAAPAVRRPGPLMKPWPCSFLQVPKVLLIGRNFSAGLLQTVSRIRGSRQLKEEGPEGVALPGYDSCDSQLYRGRLLSPGWYWHDPGRRLHSL